MVKGYIAAVAAAYCFAEDNMAADWPAFLHQALLPSLHQSLVCLVQVDKRCRSVVAIVGVLCGFCDVS